MWPCPGTVPALLQPGVPGAVQSPSAFVPALPPAARTRSWAQPGHSLSQPLRGTSVPATVTLGGKRSPPHSSLGAGQMLLLQSWTLARMGCPRRLGLAGDGAGALARTKPQSLGASLPARTPQPCSAWGSAPPAHHSHTASPRWLCMAWGHGRTLSLPLDLSSHSRCPHPLSHLGLDRPCVGTDLTAALGGHCGTPAPSFHCKGLPPLPRDSWREFLRIS